MTETRDLFCPACGNRRQIPADTPAGKNARCASCSTAFAIPAPIKIASEDDTVAAHFNIQDMPTDLRNEIGIVIEDDEPPLTPKKKRERRFKDTQEMIRKALDLEPDGRPRVHTGVRIIDVTNLPDEDE